MPLCTDQRNADDNCVRLHLCLSLFVCTYPSISRFSFLSSQIQTVDGEEVLENPEQPKKEKAKVQRTAPPPKKEEEPEPPAFPKKEKAKAQRSAAPPARTRLERLMQDVQREATSNRVRLSFNRASLDPGIRNKSGMYDEEMGKARAEDAEM